MNKSFSPYFTEPDAQQVRAAFLAAGHLEGYTSITEFIEAATMREGRQEMAGRPGRSAASRTPDPRRNRPAERGTPLEVLC